MSIISIDFEKQVNEVEEFILYHCVIKAEKRKNINNSYKTYMYENNKAFFIISKYKEEIYNTLSKNKKIKILFTSIDNYKVYVCFKISNEELYILDNNIYDNICYDLDKNVFRDY